MPTGKSTPAEFRELRLTIPPTIMELITKAPRLVIKGPGTIGIWPVDPRLWAKADMQKLMEDPAVTENFEMVLMPRM